MTDLVQIMARDPFAGGLSCTRTIDPRHFFPTIESAVEAFRQETGASWTAVAQPSADQAAPGPTAAGTGPPLDMRSARAQDEE